MSLRQRDLESYFMLDHRQTEGLSEEVEHNAGLPAGAGTGLFEAPFYTCSHCQKMCIVRMPRTNDIPYCSKCSHGICNACNLRRVASGGDCKTWSQFIDEVGNALTRQSTPPQELILPHSVRDQFHV